jgi:GAF domain-containing protein
MIRTWLSDTEDTNPSFLQMTRNILVSTIIANLAILFLVGGSISDNAQNLNATIALSITAVLEVVALILTLRGKPAMAKEVVPVALLLAVTYTAASANGLHDISMLGFPVVLVVSALLLRHNSIFLTTPLAVVSIGYVAYADMAGINDSPMAASTGVVDAIISSVLIISISALLQLLIVRLNASVREARQNEQAQVMTNANLLSLQESLENRIIERTAELTAANRLNERSTRQFQITAQVARVIANIRDVSQLLPSIASIISERFGFYHVGIFLLDEGRQYAVLSAANSEGGQKMLLRGHRLRVGETSTVGYTATTGLARVALDVGTDSVYFSNPDLPETRSEIALPLKLGELLIGVLDVQSQESHAFIQEDVETLTTLADQVAIAIRNAQLLRDTQAAIAESQMLFGNYINKAWRSASQADPKHGYRFTGTNPIPLESPLYTDNVRTALERGEIVSTQPHNGKGRATFTVPVKLRDEIIGTISVNLPEGSQTDVDNVDIVQAASERIALALENATLLEESQRRAAKERTIGEISAKIGGLVNIENILQTAVQELGNTLPNTDIVIQFTSENSGHLP